MLQLPAIQALLNAACKVDNNACISLLGDYLNPLHNNSIRVALEDAVLEEPAKKRNLGGSGQASEMPTPLQLCRR